MKGDNREVEEGDSKRGDEDEVEGDLGGEVMSMADAGIGVERFELVISLSESDERSMSESL